MAKIPQVWIFIVGLNNCPPATFKQIIPSPDPELHNGKELLLPAWVPYHGQEIPQQCKIYLQSRVAQSLQAQPW